MSELRDFSRRKLSQAIKWNQDADSLDQLMVFKIVLTEIDGMCFPSKEDSNTGLQKLLDLKAKVASRCVWEPLAVPILHHFSSI